MALKSWVESANGHPDYPLENLPIGRFRWNGEVHHGFAVGDSILIGDDRNEARQLLTEEAADREETAKRLVKQSDVEMLLPYEIGNYTDFYASI
ncbi:MAG TPA: hypothetical protein VGJ82_08415, partial [Thermoanaerobaculia bacterium]